MCQLLRAGPGGRVTRLLVTFLGSQLDKPRLFLVASNREHVNIAVIINAIVLYILVFMYLLEIKLLLLLEIKLLVIEARVDYGFRFADLQRNSFAANDIMMNNELNFPRGLH